VVGQPRRPDTQDSNVFRPGGTWQLTVEPHDGDGSHIRLVLDRRFKGKGWLFYPAVALLGGGSSSAIWEDA
jgi:hypothetical protein